MRRSSFHENWQFTRCATGERETVELPHDATIAEPRDPDIRIGYLSAFYHGGKYKYEKHFPAPRGKPSISNSRASTAALKS